MCIRAGSNGLESMKNLMTMSLMAVIAESLAVDIDTIGPNSNLRRELGMDETGRKRLEAMIADYFDGLTVNLDAISTVSMLLDRVVMNEFSDATVRQYINVNAVQFTHDAA